MLSVLVKFYSLPLLLFAALKFKKHLSRLSIYLITIPASLLTFANVVIYSILGQQGVPFAVYGSFGLPSYGYWILRQLRLEDSLAASSVVSIYYVVGFVFVATFMYAITRLLPASRQNFDDRISNAQYTALDFSIISFAQVYLTGMSYDYRLVFLLFLLIVFSSTARGRYASVVTLVGLISLWSGNNQWILESEFYRIGIVLEFLSDMFILLLFSLILIWRLRTIPMQRYKKLWRLGELNP